MRSCRQALITQLRDLLNVGVILKKDLVRKLDMAMRLETDNDFDDPEATMDPFYN